VDQPLPETERPTGTQGSGDEGAPPVPDNDLTAADVAWDIEPLVAGEGPGGVGEMLDRSEELADRLDAYRGRIADLTAAELAEMMGRVAEMEDLMGRAMSYASLRFSVDTTEGALLQAAQEKAARIGTRVLFIDLEWAALDDARVEELLADPVLDFCAHHLRSQRRYRDHLLSEPEEKILTELSVTGASAWSRLFDQLTSAIRVDLDSGGEGPGSEPVALEQALSLLSSPDRETRRRAAEAVTAGLAPGIENRAYVFNTLAQDKAVRDRLRGYDTWISSRNLANEASDESVAALIDAVVARYEIPHRWYELKSRILGHRLADYDRGATVAESERQVGWSEARELVLDSYRSFSPELADTASRFFANPWIDAPLRPRKRPGAFCAYTVPSAHPFVLLNWTSKSRDVLTLAHELGHACHAYLSRPQGIFHFSTPLTVAETASVFGETVTLGRMLEATDDPAERLALLAESLEGSIATVFRQTAMNRFEDAVHTERREEGELSVDRFGELWAQTQSDVLGPAVDVTEGYRMWWSYIPHFISTPGYVYAYAFGQLLALSVYHRYEEQGPEFVPRYLEMLAAGGSRSPEELAAMVGCDLGDPGFWDGGLDIVARQLDLAEEAARAAGRIR